MNSLPKIKAFGEQAILLEWKKEISLSTHNDVMNHKNYIDTNFKEGIIETVPTYWSLAVYLKQETDCDAFISKLKSGFVMSENIPKEKKIIHIPVCYDVEFGIDLLEMEQQLNLPISEIIKRHTANMYPVLFLGFLPGFPYLSGLDSSLAVKRKSNPRPLVLAGSVGIAGHQTGVYTVDSPGGWNIIGRSPLRFFDVLETAPCLIQPGDVVRFYEISRKQYEKISDKVATKSFKLRTEVQNV